MKPATIAAAAVWFARLRGSKARQARAGFARWRLRDARRAQAYREVEDVWDLAGAAAANPEIAALIDETTPVARPCGKQRKPVGAWARRAACVAVVLGVVGIALLSSRVLNSSAPTSPLIYQTAVGEQRDIALDDGSVVRLDAASRLEVQLEPRRRDVRLVSGRARFIVAKDTGRPFTVRAGAAGVKALGTVFDVSRLAGAVDVALFEGRVEVRRNEADGATDRLILTPGQGVRVEGREGLYAQSLEARGAGWTEGRLVFAGAPLSEVVDELNRYSSRQIILDLTPGDERRFRGEFRSNEIDAAVQILSVLYDLSATDDQNGDIRLREKNSVGRMDVKTSRSSS